MLNCEGCNWQLITNNETNNNDKIKCVKSISYGDTEIIEPCDVNCFLPYPVEYFNEPRENVIINDNNTFKINYDDPMMIEAKSFILFHSSPDDVNTNANSSGIKEKFKCGINNLSDLEGINEIENLSEYIDLPDSEMLEKLLLMNKINTNNLQINGFLDFFIEDSRNYQNIEFKLKEILFTNDNDNNFIRKINNYSSLKELGENLEDLKYIEKKIMKFLGTNINEFIDLFNSIEDNFFDCNNGLSMKSMDFLLNFLKLNIDINLDEQTFIEEKRVLDTILKFVPNLMKKILDISENVEIIKCGNVSKKTLLYKEIYSQLFIHTNPLKVELPNLGISEFFSEFNNNIYTKIILLVFIGFIISRIISLFTVNFQVKT